MMRGVPLMAAARTPWNRKLPTAKLAFLDGWFWGSEQRDVDHEEDDSDRYTDASEPTWPVEVGMV